jgi:ferredoxin
MKHHIYLCEACLECRDPKLYCKHRSSCPIWFLSKRKARWAAEDNQAAATGHTVTFSPGGRMVAMPDGSTPLGAAQAAGVHLNASCSGNGSCGKCKVIVSPGETKTNRSQASA